MRMDRVGCLCVAVGLACAGPLAGAEVRMGKGVSYPHVGLTLAVPEGFVPLVCVEPYDAMRAVLHEGSKTVQGITVSVFPVGKKKTHAQFAEAMISDMKENLAVRNVKVLKTAEVRIAGLGGTGCRVQYTFRGVRTTAARVFFTRDVPATGGRLCYVLTIESSPKHEDSLLTILDGVMKSFTLSPIRRPAELTVSDLGPVVEAAEHGFALCPPRGWYVVAMRAGIEAAQTDYTAGGMPTATLQVTVRPTPKGGTSKGLAQRHLARAAKAFPAAKTVWQGETELSGLGGYQFVLHQEPQAVKAPSSSSSSGSKPPAKKGAAVTLVQTVLCVPGVGKTPGKTYDLVLLCHGGQAETARATMTRIAATFKVLSKPKKPKVPDPVGTKPKPAKPGPR